MSYLDNLSINVTSGLNNYNPLDTFGYAEVKQFLVDACVNYPFQELVIKPFALITLALLLYLVAEYYGAQILFMFGDANMNDHIKIFQKCVLWFAFLFALFMFIFYKWVY
jgi:hypothetical protein